MTGLSACHPERSEGPVALGAEMLRGVYTERSECAQHHSAVTHTDAWINMFMCIIVEPKIPQILLTTQVLMRIIGASIIVCVAPLKKCRFPGMIIFSQAGSKLSNTLRISEIYHQRDVVFLQRVSCSVKNLALSSGITRYSYQFSIC